MAALILVALFMIFYYRFGGSIADVALLINFLIILGFMASLKATLTLPGIAGLILSIGMSVDTNVLIFERIREELGTGKPMRTAVDLGYKRAFGYYRFALDQYYNGYNIISVREVDQFRVLLLHLFSD